MGPGGANASLRELADAGGVALPTVRHYFGDRNGLITAAIDELGRGGDYWLAVARTTNVELPLGPSCRWLLGSFVQGWVLGLGPMVSQTLAAGLQGPALGPPVVERILEPLLQATEARLAVHAARGELSGDLRHAALALVCPALLALLHQHDLHGASCRPLDVDAFLDDHVARFVRGWGP